MPRNSSTSSSDLKKFCVQAALFLVAMFALDRAIGAAAEHFFFETTDGDTGGQINGLLARPRDVVVIGSSRAESHYVPSVISQSLGETTFNAGFKGSNALYDYGVEELVLTAYRPKLIIYDFSAIAVARSRSDPYEKLAPLYPYWRTPAIWDLIGEDGWERRAMFFSRIYPYNSKLHSVAIFNVRKSRPGADEGYVAQTSTMTSRPVGELRMSERSYDPTLIEHLEKLIATARASGVRVVVVISPRHMTGTYPLPEAIRKLLDDAGVPVLDFDLTQFPQFADPALYRDEEHLNHEGAVQFSRLVGERIKQLPIPKA